MKTKYFKNALQLVGMHPTQRTRRKANRVARKIATDKNHSHSVSTLLFNEYFSNEYTKDISKKEQKLLNKTVEKVLQKIQLHKIVGFQPLEGPVGLAFHLECGQTEKGSLKLEIVEKAVTCFVCRLKTHFTQSKFTEATVDAIASKIVGEFEGMVFKAIEEIADKECISRSFAENTADLEIFLQQKANEIRKKTKRGVGNRIVVNPDSKFSFFKQEDNPLSMERVKTVNETMETYATSSFPTNKILIAYNGTGMDAGLIFCPYVLLVPLDTITNERSESIIPLTTRYGMYIPNTAKNYFKVIEITD